MAEPVEHAVPAHLPDMAKLPTGTITFWFTDGEGSTGRWEQRPNRVRAAVEERCA